MQATGETIDLMDLLREDLDPWRRVSALEHAAENAWEQIDQIASPEVIEKINETFDIEFVFNQHGNVIHAGQSLEHVGTPFITFVESAEDVELDESQLFNISLKNAFNVRFNDAQSEQPQFRPLAIKTGRIGVIAGYSRAVV